MTPFTEMTTRALGHSLRAGVRYSLSEPLSRMFQLELADERTDSLEGIPDYRGSLMVTWTSGAGLR